MIPFNLNKSDQTIAQIANPLFLLRKKTKKSLLLAPI